MSNASRTLHLSALLMLAAALPVPSLAASRPTITLQLNTGDGNSVPPIDVSDLSVSMARTLPTPKSGTDADKADKADETMDQATLTLDTSALSNAALINWIGKGGGNSSVELKVSGGDQATSYVMTGITTWSLSASHSVNGGMYAQVSLSVGAKHMTINGATLN